MGRISASFNSMNNSNNVTETAGAGHLDSVLKRSQGSSSMAPSL